MRYLITGGSGYIGTRLVELLSRREDTEKIVIADVVPPRGAYQPKTEFEQVDVRDRGTVHAVLKRANPDVLVHLAFILNPSHDEAFMYEVDVNGTHNVLEAAAEVGIGQVLVTTSAVAYGAFPDNPDPITEDHPVRGVARFSYARDKTESDRIVQLWALQHPAVVTTIVRPCIVFGPNVDNYLVRLWSKQPFTVDAGNLDGTIQFVHEDDVVEAISRLLLGRHAGQFNLSPEGLMTLRECAEVLGSPIRKMPFWLFRGIATLMWRLHLSEVPPGQLDFARYPWVVANEKLKETLGWTPRYSTRESFEIAMRAQGKLPPADPPASTPEAP
jgi:UDP-glucose 4-epimerase